jgi:hypothetical protein
MRRELRKREQKPRCGFRNMLDCYKHRRNDKNCREDLAAACERKADSGGENLLRAKGEF